jgi:hypothetical protein
MNPLSRYLSCVLIGKLKHSFLAMFAKLGEATVTSKMSVRPHGMTGFPPDGFL